MGRLRRWERRGFFPGADKNYDARATVADLRGLRVTPHIARNDHPTKTGNRRRSSVGGRTTCHPGCAASQVIRKRIEEVFGWIRQGAGLRQTRYRGLGRVGWALTLTAAAYSHVRLPGLLARAAP